MHWLILVLSSLFEAIIPLLVISSENYTNPIYVCLLLITVSCSILGLRYSMKVIPLTIAYMVWTSLGILGTAIIGATVLDEILDPTEMLSLLVIIIAVVGLRVSSVEQQPDGPAFGVEG